MSDLERQEAARAAKESPDDEQARARAERANLRAGLGWYGEGLPRQMMIAAGSRCLVANPPHGMFAGDQRSPHEVNAFGPQDYEYVINPPEWAGSCGGVPPTLVLSMVYVPGGEVACRCRWGHLSLSFRPSPGWEGEARVTRGPCEICGGTGREKVRPYYLARFPLTWSQYLQFVQRAPHPYPEPPQDLLMAQSGVGPMEASLRSRRGALFLWGSMGEELYAQMAHHPVVNVTHGDAMAFCRWSGLRLPTLAEWRWAALGTDLPEFAEKCPTCHGDGRTEDRMGLCGECVPHGGRRVRRLPWGNAPPTADRVVMATATTCGACDGDGMDHGSPFVPPGELCEACGGRGAGPDYLVNPHTAPVMTSEKVVSLRVERDLKGMCPHGYALCHRCDIRATGRLLPSRPRGVSWCGAYEMAGNVWERCRGGGIRGGSFRSSSLNAAFDPVTLEPDPTMATDSIGFRVALSAG